MVKFNVDLDDAIVNKTEALLWEYKDVFAWSYKELTYIPLHKIIQHRIELDTTIPLTHQAMYQMNPNYAAMVKTIFG
jgi:hypothetical protein